VLSRGGEADLDVEAAPGPGSGGDGGAVGVRDRAHDREPEPEAVRAARPGSVESLERLEEPIELVRRDLRAGVPDGEDGAVVERRGREADAAAVDVVADRIAQEVGDEPLDQAWVAGRARRLDGRVERQPVCVGGGDGGGPGCGRA
jgi:hypothetical protein